MSLLESFLLLFRVVEQSLFSSSCILLLFVLIGEAWLRTLGGCTAFVQSPASLFGSTRVCVEEGVWGAWEEAGSAGPQLWLESSFYTSYLGGFGEVDTLSSRVSIYKMGVIVILGFQPIQTT